MKVTLVNLLLEQIRELSTSITSTMNLKINQNHLKMAYACWCGLGFYRGTKAYNYSYNKRDKDDSYMYIYSIGHGCRGSFYYFLPIFLPIMIHKEFYRLEVNLRNIEKEKKSGYYNELLF